MRERLRWREGAPKWRREIERWLSGDVQTRVLRETPQRRLVHLRDAGLLVKEFRPGSGRRRLREGLKACLGRASATREWRALRRLRAANVPVPEPLGRARLPGGRELLVLRLLEGRSLAEALRVAPAQRRRLLREVGALVRRLHAAGAVHGDLHVGNLWLGRSGPLILDLQHARRRHQRLARLRDLGALDFSLETRGVSLADRLRVRMTALGLDTTRALRARRALREIGAAGRAHAQRHYRSRTRRCLRPGRRFARVRLAQRRGLRLRSFPEPAVAQALAAHRRALERGGPGVLKDDARARVTAVCAEGRAVVVKEVVKGGFAKRIADLWRGSSGRRAWLGGHGLKLRGIGAATPLAFLEQRRFGIPVGSLVVLEDLGPARPAHRGVGRRGAAWVELLLGLTIRLHRLGVVHGDLQTPHIFIAQVGGAQRAAFIDLEGVRFRRRLWERERVQALAELNASLDDLQVPATVRCRAFARYARALPFPSGNRAALERIVRLSLARRHFWTGEGCALARSGLPTPSLSSAPSPGGPGVPLPSGAPFPRR